MTERALLDTNMLIYREAATVVRQNIGLVFNWLDCLGYVKLVHPVSVAEINQHQDERVRRSFRAKLASYRLIQAPAAMNPVVQKLSSQRDTTDNARNDSILLNELYCDRADLLITEDRGLARKADVLGIGDRVFTIDAFLEKVTAEHPDFVEYEILSVEKTLFGRVNVSDGFFDSFRLDYPGFDKWFNRKSEESVYVCRQDDKIVAFLYLKTEDEREPYHDM
ncbi:MAG: hypothetical protein IT305_25995 [Chloroflexi bacterium]|nr:hypothetical protein [Chloroflexota bacterium]